jgi:RNA polymerase sigma factor (TIGR02999 family)
MADDLQGLYRELHSLAQRALQKERGDHTLQATALVHEAYLRMVAQGFSGNRGQALALGARMMRRVLVDYARRRLAQRRAEEGLRFTLSGEHGATAFSTQDLVDLDAALGELAQLDERKSKVIELRFFGGLSMAEIGTELGVSPRTVADDWSISSAWLRQRLDV